MGIIGIGGNGEAVAWFVTHEETEETDIGTDTDTEVVVVDVDDDDVVD